MERWHAVPGFEGKYEISDLGRVRCLQNNRGRPVRKPKLLVQRTVRGYKRIALWNGRRQRKEFRVHRLVLEAFVGPAKGRDADHIDFNRGNNVVDNLRWVKASRNRGRKAG